MKTLSSKDAIGITWDADGFCYGIRSRKIPDGYRVLSYWSERSDKASEIPFLLACGLDKLGKDGSTVIVAGGSDPVVGVADVSLPSMSAHDLRNALRYEVDKHAPLAADDLSWGYRILRKNDSLLDIRLYYLRRSEWRNWTTTVAGMQQGIDMLLPPLAAIDPVFNGAPVVLAGMPGMAFAPFQGDEKGREWLPFDQGANDLFGALPAPLETPGLDLGDMATVSEADQHGFAGAVILSLYGLEGTIKHDSAKGPELPAGVKLARHRGSRLLAGLLVSYLLVACAITLGVKYFSASATLRDIRQTNMDLREQLAALEKKEKPGNVFDDLQNELQVLTKNNNSSVTEVLVSLTDLLDESLWVSNFTWKNGRIEMDVRSTGDDTTFLGTLEKSGLFTDIVPLRKVVDPRNAMTLKVQMRPYTGDEEVKP